MNAMVLCELSLSSRIVLSLCDDGSQFGRASS